MADKFLTYCKTHNLIQEGDNIVIGVSGGADSMCLLFLLHQIQSKMNLHLTVIHVNHKLRPSADAEARYVSEMCEKWSIPFFMYSVDVNKHASEQKQSTEEAGRELRYQLFDDTLQICYEGKGKIAIAHNRNDRAETVLFNLFRGSGLRGLTGINVTRDNIIRPIMYLDRQEIEEILNKNQIHYCIDESNAEDTYTRNRIRNHILNYANENICSQTTMHINDAADLLAETDAYLYKTSGYLYDTYIKRENEAIIIDAEGLSVEEPLLVKYVIMRCLTNLAGSAKDITATHVHAVEALLDTQVGKMCNLPYGMLAVRGYHDLKLVRNAPKDTKQSENQVPIPICNLKEGISVIFELQDEERIIFTLQEASTNQIIPEKRYTKWFDYDKITTLLTLRNREEGDFLTILGPEAGTEVKKSLKQFFINEKIPRADRNPKMLLADGSHIIWVIGHRISQHYKVTKETKKILQVQVRGGAIYGREN